MDCLTGFWAPHYLLIIVVVVLMIMTFFAVAVNKFRTDPFRFNTGCLKVYVSRASVKFIGEVGGWVNF